VKDEALCAAASLDKLAQRNLEGRKFQHLQLAADSRAAVIHDYIFLNHNIVLEPVSICSGDCDSSRD